MKQRRAFGIRSFTVGLKRKFLALRYIILGESMFIGVHLWFHCMNPTEALLVSKPRKNLVAVVTAMRSPDENFHP